MKKFILICSALLFVAFLIPALYITGAMGAPEPVATAAEDGEEHVREYLEGYEYITILPLPEEDGESENEPPAVSDRDRTVRVLIGTDIEEMTVAEYLEGVVAGEMPALYPAEALKAQAVAARTYMCWQMRSGAKHQGADVCSSPACCQVYRPLSAAAAGWGDDAALYQAKIRYAVGQTDGQLLLYEGEPAQAVFHATSAGATENSADVWGEDLPYLRSVDSPGDLEAEKYEGRVEISLADCKKKLQNAWPGAKLGKNAGGWFTDIERTEVGHVKKLKAGGVEVTGAQIRRVFGLLSSNFTVSVGSDTVVFSTRGYGHGVGMSQTGARAMALEGKRYTEILEWYYPGCEVK